ncbi:MAG: Mbeg1-like protein [Bifidobacterium sp.]|uniref:DUF2974 domain-containing protein n=1 Tax=Bifidobacterium fermentum TaxID=3059035 RepID=A0AB39UDN2_9BIFI
MMRQYSPGSLQSSVYGGKPFSTPESLACITVVHQLEATSESLARCTTHWREAIMRTACLPAQAPLCPALSAESSHHPGAYLHTLLQPTWLVAMLTEVAASEQTLSDGISELARLLARAHSTYSHAEETTLRMLAGLAAGFGIGMIAHGLSGYTSLVSALKQGNDLSVRQVEGISLPAARSVRQALSNLQRIGSQGDGYYATIAIQRYVDAKGLASWVVTIPGTDSHADTPIGWLQNVELMSDSAERRMNADSVRFVLAAMKEAGIRQSDKVALVGHSQGGIVAATIAADAQREYQISHVITAGSPVGNHPIPQKTWVTSIEVDRDVVPGLDGRRNPSNASWLSVRARTTSSAEPAGMACKTGADRTETEEEPQSERDCAVESDAAVEASKGEHHSMEKQQEAWNDALHIGSPAASMHDEHFKAITSGTLESTRHYQGRLHAATG